MKLNPDCIRDTLLYLEDNLGYTDSQTSMEHIEISIAYATTEISRTCSYSEEDVQYSIEKLLEIDFIRAKAVSHDKSGYIVSGKIDDITWSGHNFLNNIRPNSIWDATKAGASKLGLMSVHALSSISTKIVETVVTNPDIINKIVMGFFQQ